MKKTILFLLILETVFMFAVGFQQAAAAVPSQEQQNMDVVKFAGKLRATMDDIHVMGRAIKLYTEDYHQAPQANSAKELSKILQPFYIKTLPLADAWDNELLYKADPKNPKNYWIASPGSDRKFQGFDQKGTWKFEEGEKGQDLVLANGDFTYMPNLEKEKQK